MSRLSSTYSKAMALGGIMAACSLAFLWLACMLPSGKFGMAAAAGLFPMAATVAGGRSSGYLCWAASGLLGLMVLPDKGISVLYLGFLGLFPVVKGRIEAFRCRPLEYTLKILYFNAALMVFGVIFKSMFLPMLPGWLSENMVAVFAGGNVIFLLYDYGLSKLIAVISTAMRANKHY